MDAMRESGLFEDVNAFEASMSEIDNADERNLALAWFYKNHILTKDPEAVIDISILFEEMIGPDFETLLDEVGQIEQDMRIVAVTRTALQTQAEMNEGAVRDLRADIERLKGSILHHMDQSDAAAGQLRSSAEAAQRQMDALVGELERAEEVTVTQLRQWDSILASCRNLTEDS
jgi:hypothetical protein